MGVLIQTCLLTLFFSCSLCSSTSTAVSFGTALTEFHENRSEPILNGHYTLGFTQCLPCPPPTCPSTCGNSPPRELISENYNDLILTISEKLLMDTLKLCSFLKSTLGNWLERLWRLIASLLHVFISLALWSAIYCLLQSGWALLKILGYLITKQKLPVLILTSLAILTRLITSAVSFIYGGLPAWTVSIICFLPKKIFQALFSNKSYVNEKAVQGFNSYTIPQSPPKNSVLELVYKDGSHLGYATCINLVNGENALITALHCVKPEALIKGVKTGNKVKLSAFKQRIHDKDGDFALFSGPPSWESILGCKGAHIVTSQHLALGAASLYRLSEAGWVSTNAKIVGAYENRVRVESDTLPGDSGSPYWSGKTVLGVHTGYPSDGTNCNIMTPIPHIPGVTAPIFVYETTAPQGKIFLKEIPVPEFKPIKLKGKDWNDYESEGSSFYDDPTYLEPLTKAMKSKQKFVEECAKGDSVISLWQYTGSEEGFLEWATSLMDAVVNQRKFHHEVHGDVSTWFRQDEIIAAIRRYKRNPEVYTNRKDDIWETCTESSCDEEIVCETAPRKYVDESLNEPGSTVCPPTGKSENVPNDTRKITPKSGEEMLGEIQSTLSAKINLKQLEDRIVQEAVQQLTQSARQRVNKGQKASPNSSKKYTNGKQKAGTQKFQDSETAGPSQVTTTPKEKPIQNGEKRWLPRTPNSGQQ
nr:MAG: polyprotein [Plant associated polerovirus 1]